MLTVGGLFSGIGGWELGLERAGMRTVWFCEQDAFCQRVLAKHWPGVPCYPDIRELTAGHVEPVDVLCGGFPCQDISIAGRGAGIEGERSGLWSEYARLVCELRPRYVLVENVAALLARGLDVVLADLAACGYDAEWDCIPASAVGAPHRRDRIWLVAYPRCERGSVRGEAGHLASSARAGEVEGAERQRNGDASDDRRTDVAHSDGAGSQGHGRLVERAGEVAAAASGPAGGAGALGDPDSLVGATGGSREGEREAVARSGSVERALGSGGSLGDYWLTEPDVGRVADGVPARVDRLRSLGNALVPQIAQWIGEQIVNYEESIK